VLTAATVLVNPALVAPAATVTDVGTLTAPLSLVRLTAKPLLPATELSVTVQLSLAEPVIEICAQVIELSEGVLDPADAAFP
jgi:hypothetical protein